MVLRNRSSSLNYGPSNLPTDNRPVTSAVHVSSAVTPSTHVGDLFNSTPIHKLRKETLSGIYKSGSSNPQEFILDVSPESSNSPYSLEKEANFTSTPKHRPTLQSPIVFPPPNTLGNNSVYESANGSNSRSSTNTISESYKPALLLLAKEESKEYEPGHNDTYNNSSSDESKLIAPVLLFQYPNLDLCHPWPTKRFSVFSMILKQTSMPIWVVSLNSKAYQLRLRLLMLL